VIEPKDATSFDAPSSSLGGTDTLAAGASEMQDRASSEQARGLERGASIGRYVALGQLGAGAMGVVYAGYDPELDRKVAIKLLLPQTRHGADARTRLLREAQALAKLSHPNIVAVHDVGTVDDQVWIAMEFVAGKTLRAWLDEKPRSWREVTAVVGAAGRGLASAHAQGLVHRDFKPDNVMIGSDGRTRVMDFGLARAVVEEAEPFATAIDDDAAKPARRALHEAVTRAGALAGTPAYMAAEQWDGGRTDARTDQFAFCTTLWEGIFGERPFHGETTVELAANVLAGRVEIPPGVRRAPSWLRKVVARGLSPAQSDRWPSMTDLLDALDRGQARARRRQGLFATAAVAALAAAVFGARDLDERRRIAACETEGGEIENSLNDETRSAIEHALVGTGVPYAKTTAEKVMPWLDSQAEGWRAARTDACLDASVRGLGTGEDFERSLWCLEERRMELDALVDALLHPDAQAVQIAVVTAAGLTPVGPCRDAGALARLPAPPPVDRRDEIRVLRARLAGAGAMGFSGKYAAGAELARAVAKEADELGWPPLAAAARADEAYLLTHDGPYQDAERIGIEAYFQAAEVGDWVVAARAAAELSVTVGERGARYLDGLAWGRHALIALTHAGDPEQLRESDLVGKLANIRFAMGEYAEAREMHERALTIRENALGPSHVSVGTCLNNLALVHYAMGDLDRAQALHERALALWEEALGPTHPQVATSLNNLGAVARANGDLEGARELYARALVVWEQVFGPEHPQVAASLNNLAGIAYAEGDYARARELMERAIAAVEKDLGPEHPQLAASLANLGVIVRATGDNAGARALYERALAIREKVLGPEHQEVASNLMNLARLHLVEGDPSPAIPLAERAALIYDRHEGAQQSALEAEFVLALALAASGRDLARARSLAERARDGFRAAGESKPGLLAEVEAWLAAHESKR